MSYYEVDSNLEIFAKHCTAYFVLGVLQYFLPFASIWKALCICIHAKRGVKPTWHMVQLTSRTRNGECLNKFNIMRNGTYSSFEAFFNPVLRIFLVIERTFSHMALIKGKNEETGLNHMAKPLHRQKNPISNNISQHKINLIDIVFLTVYIFIH